MRITKEYVSKLGEKDISHLSQSDLLKVVVLCNKAYYNKGEKLIEDDLYDDIKDRIHHNNEIHKQVGHKAPPKNKVVLPVWMGSMNKIKEEDDINLIKKWVNKYGENVVISDKLDGISCLLYNNGNNVQLYTRGDGQKGTDISMILPYISSAQNVGNITNNLKNEPICVRGELIISKSSFQHLIDHEIIHKQSNARNVVSGIVMSLQETSKVKEILQYVQFVVYEYIPIKNENPITMMSPSDQFEKIKQLGFTTPFHQQLSSFHKDNLIDILTHRKTNGDFDIDGIVIYQNAEYVRNQDGNPSNAFAFKMKTMNTQTTVLFVEWNVSKDRYLKPVVHIDPITINGVNIKKVTGFSAKYIQDNKIGPNAIVTITRSGDVIPKITSIIKASDKSNLLPNFNYKWTDTNVDIFLVNDTNESNKAAFVNTVTKLDIKGLKKGMISKLFDNDVKTLKDLYDTTKGDLLKIDNIKELSASNIIQSIRESYASLTLTKVIVSSNIMGRGIGMKTLDLIMNTYPDIFVSHHLYEPSRLVTIKGIEHKTATLFISNIPKLLCYLDENKLNHLLKQQQKSKSNDTTTNNKYENMVFVFSGIRDYDLQYNIRENGGQVDTNYTKKTTHIITKKDYAITTTIQKALDHGKKIVYIDDPLFS